jgi:metallo-beta-lactamase class B
LRFVALFPLAGATEAQTLKDLLATYVAAWDKPTEPFKVIDNIYYVGTDGLASYLITSPQGHILVDTAMPEAAPQIKGSIEKLGFKGQRHQIPFEYPRALGSRRRAGRNEKGKRSSSRRRRS